MNAMLALLSRDADGLLLAALVAVLGIMLCLLARSGIATAPGALLVAAQASFSRSRTLAVFVRLGRVRRALPRRRAAWSISAAIAFTCWPKAKPARAARLSSGSPAATPAVTRSITCTAPSAARRIDPDRPARHRLERCRPVPRSTTRARPRRWCSSTAPAKGPFVWAGHSFGGLFAANVARRRPDLVHTLVLLDPTPLETIVFGPRLSALKDMRRGAWLGGFAQLFGIDLRARHEAKMRATPAYAKALDATRAVLGPEVAAARAIEAHSGSFFAEASIYRELAPEGVAACASNLVVYDRDLGDLPLWLVAPRSDGDADIALLARSPRRQRRQRPAHVPLLRRHPQALPSPPRRARAASSRRRAPATTSSTSCPDFTIGVMRRSSAPAPTPFLRSSTPRPAQANPMPLTQRPACTWTRVAHDRPAAHGLARRDLGAETEAGAGYLDALTDRYRVLLVDYPGIGESRDIAPQDLAADLSVPTLLGVATAAGFDRFAYWGYLVKRGAVGLQLAARTDRLTALVVGGWPPLGAPYAGILEATRRQAGQPRPSSMKILRNASQYRQWEDADTGMIEWDEAVSVARIACPKLVMFGGDGDLVEAGMQIPIASAIQGRARTRSAGLRA